MPADAAARTELTKNQSAVFSALRGAGKPLGAYEILDQVRDQGFRAPLQVYRALQKLMELRLVHRIESRNAFVACDHRQGMLGSARNQVPVAVTDPGGRDPHQNFSFLRGGEIQGLD